MTTCFPLLIYIFCIILQLFAAYHSGNITKMTENNNSEVDYTKIIIHVVGYIFCILLLKYLCNSGQMIAAWIIVLLPCIITCVSLLSLAKVVNNIPSSASKEYTMSPAVKKFTKEHPINNQ